MYTREIVTLDMARQTISVGPREMRITLRKTYILRAMALCFPGYVSNAILRDLHSVEYHTHPSRARRGGYGSYNSQMCYLRQALGYVLRVNPVDTMAVVAAHDVGAHAGQRLLYPVRVIDIDGFVVEPPDPDYRLPSAQSH